MVTLPCTATRRGFTKYISHYTGVFSFTTTVSLLFEAVALLLLLLLLLLLFLWVPKHAGTPSFLSKPCTEICLEGRKISHSKLFFYSTNINLTIIQC
jgi:hypothetical protein